MDNVYVYLATQFILVGSACGCIVILVGYVLSAVFNMIGKGGK